MRVWLRGRGARARVAGTFASSAGTYGAARFFTLNPIIPVHPASASRECPVTTSRSVISLSIELCGLAQPRSAFSRLPPLSASSLCKRALAPPFGRTCSRAPVAERHKAPGRAADVRTPLGPSLVRLLAFLPLSPSFRCDWCQGTASEHGAARSGHYNRSGARRTVAALEELARALCAVNDLTQGSEQPKDPVG